MFIMLRVFYCSVAEQIVLVGSDATLGGEGVLLFCS